MAALIEIKRVQIGPENLIAHVRIADDAPLMTSEDLEATARVYHVMPHIVEHVCLGDAGETFRDAMGDTEIAHLLEHVTVELLAQTNMAGDIPAGKTWVDEVDNRTYQIELACPDDVLVAAALSCGVWILDWAYSGGADPEPNVDAIVQGLVQLVDSVADKGEDLVIDTGFADVVEEEYEEDVNEGEEQPHEDDTALDGNNSIAYQDNAPANLADQQEEVTQDQAMASGAPATEVVEAAPAEETIVAPAVEPAPQRPLWTEAPAVPTTARAHSWRYNREPETPEVAAQIDEIMATIEMPAIKTVEFDAAAVAKAEMDAAPDAPAADEQDGAVQAEADPAPQVDEPDEDASDEHIPSPYPLR